MKNFQSKSISIQKRLLYTLEDNGIGMSKSDLINQIGNIASSGTLKFSPGFERKK